jgi:hypothetical protein
LTLSGVLSSARLFPEYVDYVIYVAWPQQRKGQAPSGGAEKVNDFEAKLVTFEPAKGQKILHGETLRACSQMMWAAFNPPRPTLP